MDRHAVYEWKFQELAASIRKLRHDIEILDLRLRDSSSPEVIVAGIEGRATVRAGMQRELRFIGEA